MTFLKRLPAHLPTLQRCCGSKRLFSAIAEPVENDESVTVTVNPYKLHRLEEGPSTEVETSKSELLGMFKTMYTMRRMELAADLLYKQKLARGFLHLADGQEAVPTGVAPFSSPHHSNDTLDQQRPILMHVGRRVCRRWTLLYRHGGGPDLPRLHDSELQGPLHIPGQRWHGGSASFCCNLAMIVSS